MERVLLGKRLEYGVNAAFGFRVGPAPQVTWCSAKTRRLELLC